MRYFAKVHADYWTAKNKLEESWKEYCRSKDRVILNNEDERDAYVTNLYHKLNQLNEEHNRCKRLSWVKNPHHYQGSKYVHDTDLFIGVNGVSLIVIWEANETH